MCYHLNRGWDRQDVVAWIELWLVTMEIELCSVISIRHSQQSVSTQIESCPRFLHGADKVRPAAAVRWILSDDLRLARYIGRIHFLDSSPQLHTELHSMMFDDHSSLRNFLDSVCVCR